MNSKKWKENPAMRKGIKHAARKRLAKVYASLTREERRALGKEPMGVKKFIATTRKEA